MDTQPHALSAAIHAIRGAFDRHDVWCAIGEKRLVKILATAPHTHPGVRTLAALRSGLTALVDPQSAADPAFSATLREMIGTRDGAQALQAWAHVAPAGWGAMHASLLSDALGADQCEPGVAAALIGPCDTVAGYLRSPKDIVLALRVWGRSFPFDPSMQRATISPQEQSRLLFTIRNNPRALASCLPWLPPEIAVTVIVTDTAHGDALSAFADVAPIVRAQHAALVRRLVDRAHSMHLWSLTRLACAMGEDDVWRRVQTLIQWSPCDAERVVAAAPWDDLPEEVHTAILERADRFDICAAIAAARGRRDAAATVLTAETAAAFFAALDPAVWDALDPAVQQRLLLALPAWRMSLAVRSLGLRPDILARATLSNRLVKAVQRHAGDISTLRWTLFPIALRGCDLTDMVALIAELPESPPDPGAFFCLTSGRSDPSIIAPARATLHTPADLGVAALMQRIADGAGQTTSACALLQHALHGRSYDDLASILTLLTDDARAALMPDREALIARLAAPDHRDRMRAVVDRLAALPPEVAIPTQVALHRRADPRAHPSDTADAVAAALHAHGDIVLEITDALEHFALGAALIPLPEDARQADALRALVRDDPVIGRTLACALHGKDRRRTLLALLHAPPQHAAAVWQALAETDRRAMVAVLPAGTTECAPLSSRDPVAALALAALQSDAPALRDAGARALAARRATLRAQWDDLPPEARHALRTHPAVAVAVADLEHPPPSSSTMDGRRRRIPR